MPSCYGTCALHSTIFCLTLIWHDLLCINNCRRYYWGQKVLLSNKEHCIPWIMLKNSFPCPSKKIVQTLPVWRASYRHLLDGTHYGRWMMMLSIQSTLDLDYIVYIRSSTRYCCTIQYQLRTRASTMHEFK